MSLIIINLIVEQELLNLPEHMGSFLVLALS